MTSLDDIRSAVVDATERGWYVVPVPPGEKRPNLPHWHERGSNDPAHVDAAWRGRYAGHNYAILTGPSGLVVLDADTAPVPPDWRSEPGVHDGLDVLAFLLEAAGEPRIPDTYWIRSSRGGWHLYFVTPASGPEIRNSAGALGPGVDVRAAGGCVIGAGSVACGYRLPAGGPVNLRYELLDGREPAPLPPWLARRLTPQPQPALPLPSPRTGATEGRLAGLLRVVREGQPGDRNGRLHWAACRAGELVATGRIRASDAEEELQRAAMDAGLRGGEREARATVRSGLRAGGAR